MQPPQSQPPHRPALAWARPPHIPVAEYNRASQRVIARELERTGCTAKDDDTQAFHAPSEPLRREEPKRTLARWIPSPPDSAAA